MSDVLEKEVVEGPAEGENEEPQGEFGAITVYCGGGEKRYLLKQGDTVNSVREALRGELNIPQGAKPCLNDEDVEGDPGLENGDELDFVTEASRKG